MDNVVELIEQIKKISPVTLYNIYGFGSFYYGTNNTKSDMDFICIGNMKEKEKCIEVITDNIDLQIYSEEEFKKELDNHEMKLIESLYHPLLEQIKIDFVLDKEKLRHSVSRISDHSWVRAKKKLSVEKDYDPYKAKKAFFHSFRVRNFGIQLAKHGEIKEWTNLKPLYDEIMELPEGLDQWQSWDKQFRKRRNSLRSEFKKITPKK